MKSRHFLALSLAVVMLFSLAACGSAPASAQNKSEKAQTETQAPASAPAETQAAAPAEIKTDTDAVIETRSETRYEAFEIGLDNVEEAALEGGFRVSVTLPSAHCTTAGRSLLNS